MDHADERIVRMQKALVAFLNATGEYHDNRPRESSADSVMSHDILAFGDSRPFHNAVTLSDLAFHYTHSHLSLLAAAIAQSCEPLTCCTLVRSTLETAAIGAWVVDPTIGTVERAARVFSIRFDSIIQNIKVLQCTKNIRNSDIDQTNARKEVLAQQADALGIPVGRDKGKVLWVGRRKPGATDMISDVLDDEWMYRLLSSVAHGHHWALRQLGFAEVTSATPGPTDGRCSSHDRSQRQ